ncbi:MAG: tetratricopeptide repeat protein, partial [Planctomycetota bacterium]
EAEPLFKRSLAVMEKALGAEHPDVAIALFNLAMVYLKQGDCAAAGPLLNRALAIREKALGAEHLDVMIALFNLAGPYYPQGKYAELPHPRVAAPTPPEPPTPNSEEAKESSFSMSPGACGSRFR